MLICVQGIQGERHRDIVNISRKARENECVWSSIMLVVMHSHATPPEIEQVLQAIRDMNLTPHPMPGATRTAIGITGNVSAVDPRTLEVLPGVSELIRVTKPYKLASREMHEADTFVKLPQTTVGPGTFTMIAGPCSVET